MRKVICETRIVTTVGIAFDYRTIQIDVERHCSPINPPTDEQIFDALCAKVCYISKSCQEGLCITFYDRDNKAFNYVGIPSDKFTQVSNMFGKKDSMFDAADRRRLLALLCDYNQGPQWPVNENEQQFNARVSGISDEE